ncbi:MAG: class IV adenylate cyclase [Thermoanaerobaculum sp.]|nr:class IV adenylate cyclase [Thermoanaerobaculum sp.]
MPEEREAKLPVEDLPRVRRRLQALGAHLETPPTRESNWVLDDLSGSLYHRGCLLRLRQWGKQHLLTFKGPGRMEGGVKVRKELETGVEHVEKTLPILAELGFAVAFFYEKERESWRVGSVTVALDHTPLGDFVELEGEVEALGAVAAQLGLDLRRAVAATYAELWQEHRRKHPQAPAHMVFP